MSLLANDELRKSHFLFHRASTLQLLRVLKRISSFNIACNPLRLTVTLQHIEFRHFLGKEFTKGPSSLRILKRMQIQCDLLAIRTS
ncbi:hypothetical protein CEXT_676891 [Caerostris extrusa]|uniref:Uncharacterized protein n=1 Tax=Caerostris extrusa TaxID=172846 RepID=A0AAV4PZN5_CAEEX|nr:hypothetical protein CEXT_676891 [Caerostris extrusa]